MIIWLRPFLLLTMLRQQINRQFACPRSTSDQSSGVRLFRRFLSRPRSVLRFPLSFHILAIFYSIVQFLAFLRIAFGVREDYEACVVGIGR